MIRHTSAVLGTVAGFGAACFGWGLIEAGMYTVRRVEVPVLPSGARPIKVLHLADLHLAARQARKLDFIRRLSSLGPDMVINTGDNITEAGAIDPLLEALSPLRGLPGGFVFGSNDYHAPRFKSPLRYLLEGRSRMEGAPRELPWEALRDGLEDLGWVDLTGVRVTLPVDGLRVALRGTDDGHLGRDDYDLVAGPADPDADLDIGVTHAPYLRLLDAMTRDGMDLILAGHTHGGQVCVPGFGALITNCDLDRKRAKGLSNHGVGGNRSWLHVSGGLGTSPFAPYRFANRPETTLITLVPRPV